MNNQCDQIIDLINQERHKHNLAPLRKSQLLTIVAQDHAENMAKKRSLSHFLDGDPWTRIRAAGYNYKTAGENIAYNFNSPGAVVIGWMGSSGHRANILNRSYTETGVGAAENSLTGCWYHCQVFVSPGRLLVNNPDRPGNYRWDSHFWSCSWSSE